MQFKHDHQIAADMVYAAKREYIEAAAKEEICLALAHFLLEHYKITFEEKESGIRAHIELEIFTREQWNKFSFFFANHTYVAEPSSTPITAGQIRDEFRELSQRPKQIPEDSQG